MGTSAPASASVVTKPHAAKPGPEPNPVRARITRADFQPPPPELADRDPNAAPAEHVGGLRAELKQRDGMLHLGKTYQQNPLRVLLPVTERPGAPSLLFLLNSTAGLLDGDGQLTELDIKPGVRCFLTNQTASRVHPCPLSHASARFEIKVAAGAVVCAVPGPMIPFATSRYWQRANIDLEPGAQVVWGDILLPGRTRYAKAPERFSFDRLIQELRIRRDGRLVFHERFAWKGPWTEDEIRWHFGPYEAAASLFISGPLPTSLLPELHDGEISVHETAYGDTCVRLLGKDAEQLIAASARLALTAAAHLAGETGVWLVDSPHLVANHWFSRPPEP